MTKWIWLGDLIPWYNIGVEVWRLAYWFLLHVFCRAHVCIRARFATERHEWSSFFHHISPLLSSIALRASNHFCFSFPPNLRGDMLSNSPQQAEVYTAARLDLWQAKQLIVNSLPQPPLHPLQIRIESRSQAPARAVPQNGGLPPSPLALLSAIVLSVRRFRAVVLLLLWTCH